MGGPRDAPASGLLPAALYRARVARSENRLLIRRSPGRDAAAIKALLPHRNSSFSGAKAGSPGEAIRRARRARDAPESPPGTPTRRRRARRTPPRHHPQPIPQEHGLPGSRRGRTASASASGERRTAAVPRRRSYADGFRARAAASCGRLAPCLEGGRPGMACAHCGRRLRSSQWTADRNLKSCPNCSGNHGREHVFLPYPGEFGTTEQRATDRNPEGAQSYCQPCRSDGNGDPSRIARLASGLAPRAAVLRAVFVHFISCLEPAFG